MRLGLPVPKLEFDKKKLDFNFRFNKILEAGQVKNKKKLVLLSGNSEFVERDDFLYDD